MLNKIKNKIFCSHNARHKLVICIYLATLLQCKICKDLKACNSDTKESIVLILASNIKYDVLLAVQKPTAK